MAMKNLQEFILFLKPSSYQDNDLEDNLEDEDVLVNEVYLWYEDFLEDENDLDNEVYLWYEDFLEDEDGLEDEDCIEEEGYFEDENCLCKDVCPLISCSGAILAYEDIITLFYFF